MYLVVLNIIIYIFENLTKQVFSVDETLKVAGKLKRFLTFESKDKVIRDKNASK